MAKSKIKEDKKSAKSVVKKATKEVVSKSPKTTTKKKPEKKLEDLIVKKAAKAPVKKEKTKAAPKAEKPTVKKITSKKIIGDKTQESKEPASKKAKNSTAKKENAVKKSEKVSTEKNSKAKKEKPMLSIFKKKSKKEKEDSSSVDKKESETVSQPATKRTPPMQHHEVEKHRVQVGVAAKNNIEASAGIANSKATAATNTPENSPEVTDMTEGGVTDSMPLASDDVPTENKMDNGAALEEIPADKVIIVNQSNVSDIINGMADPEFPHKQVNHHAAGGAPIVPQQSQTVVSNKVTSYGQTILDMINSDWRMHSWGGVPLDEIQRIVNQSSSEYQYEVKSTDNGAYFLIKVGADSYRFPVNENEFIKTV